MDDVSKFDKETERFTKVGKMKHPRREHRSVGYGNIMLHVGGTGQQSKLKRLFI